MIILGVTGGIGSGKTLVCDLLRIHGIPVYDADKEAKDLNDSSPVIKEKLTELFGNDLYTGAKLNRSKLAEHIFNDKEKLLIVNKLIHTELAKHFLDWTQLHNNYPIVAIDAAVLFEANFQKYVTATITVTAPEDIRIERVLNRDKHLTIEQIKARINSQMSEEEKIKLSDFIMTNDNNHSIIEQVSNILDKTTNSSKSLQH